MKNQKLSLVKKMYLLCLKELCCGYKKKLPKLRLETFSNNLFRKYATVSVAHKHLPLEWKFENLKVDRNNCETLDGKL